MSIENEIPTFFGDVKNGKFDLSNRRFGSSPVEYRFYYVNNLRVSVTIELRSGLKFTLPPEHGWTANTLTMRIEISFLPSAVNDIERFLSGVTEESSNELKAMREAYELQSKEKRGNTYRGGTILLDYPITLDQLRNYGGSIYYDELDCVISLLPIDQSPPHPHSAEGRHQKIITTAPGEISQFGFGYTVEIIDTNGKQGCRFLNIGNNIYRIDPKKDPTRRDGIYIVANKPTNNEISLNEIGVQYYSIDSAEQLGLYRTADEAINLGDLSGGRKKEMLELEHALVVSKLELQGAKQAHDILMLEKDRDAKIRDMEREQHAKELQALREKTEHELSMERQRVKDHYDRKAHERKDHSEALKFLPSIIVGLGAVFMAIKTFTQPAK